MNGEGKAVAASLGRLSTPRPRNLLHSIGRALRQAGSRVSRAYTERRSSRLPFIVDVLRDSGLMTDPPQEGEGGYSHPTNGETFGGINNTPEYERLSRE